MPRYRKWLGYILFAVTIGGMFLYLCFPSDAVRDYLEGSASRLAPPLSLRLRDVRPAFPLGLQFEDADLGFKERPGIPLFKASRFVLMPSMRILALRGPAFRFACAAYGGKIQGVVVFKTFNWDGPVSSDIEMVDVRLGEYPSFRDWLNREFTGTLSGSVTYAGRPGSFPQGSGRGDFLILDGSVGLAQPFLGVESVDFHRIDVEMVLDRQRISLSRLDFEGEALKGKASGTVHLDRHFSRSTLDLRVALKPSSSLLSGEGGLAGAATFLRRGLGGGDLTISIRGTVAQPRINFT